MSTAETLDYDDEDEPNAARLTTVFTIPQVAKMAGWSTDRMRRHLVFKNEELDGRLLRNVSRGKQRPRWTITLAALQEIAPQWFHDPQSVQQQIEWLRNGQDELRVQLFHLGKRVDNQTARIVALAKEPRPR